MEDNLKVGDWVVSTEQYEGLDGGSIGLITEIRNDEILGCIWNNFNDGNDEVFECDDYNGYFINKDCVVKIKGEPKRNTLTLLIKRDKGKDSYGFKLNKYRSYLYCNYVGYTSIINISSGCSSDGGWGFRIVGNCAVDRIGLLKIEAILRGLKK